MTHGPAIPTSFRSLADERSPRDGRFIEEIGYYYSPFIEQFKEHLDPIMREGGKVLQEMEQIIKSPHISPNDKTRYENDYQRLLSQYAYLF